MHQVQHMKSSASSRSKVKIPEERLSFSKLKLRILIDSDTKLFKYLIPPLRKITNFKILAKPSQRPDVFSTLKC